MKKQNPTLHTTFDFSGNDLDELLNQFSIPMRNHSRRVAVCSSIMAEYAKELLHLHNISVGANFALIAHLGGTCHDIGKLLIPVLGTKVKDYLRHPSLGEELLSKIYKAMFDNKIQAQMVLDTIRHHHERPDGKGFPDSLQSKEISLNAGICAVANELDHSLYLREPCNGIETVKGYIKEQAGILYCETAVICLERAWPALLEQYAKWNIPLT